jgi:ABC-type transport system involved in multi-copper enzyme maturation permease subunit
MKVRINPVLLRELRVKMRGWRSVITIIAYLAVIILVTSFVILNMTGSPYSVTIDPNRSIGTYTYLSAIQFILVMFIAPALTSGSISGERERQTLDLLLSTKLPAVSIVLGKLFASISHVILLIVASLPVFSIIFLFGGISIIEVLELFGFYIITAITLGSIGIFFSTFTKKTSVSNVVSYGVIGLLALGTLIFTAMYSSYYSMRKGMALSTTPLIMYANPLAGFAALISGQFGGGGYGMPYIPFIGIAMPGRYPGQAAVKQMALWKGNIIFDLCLTVILITLSSIKINPVKRGILKQIKALFGKFRLGRKPVSEQ